MGIVIGFVLALLIVIVVWLYPPIQIYKDNRTKASTRIKWVLLSFLSGPFYLVTIRALFHSNPDLRKFLDTYPPVDAGGVVGGLGFALPYLVFVFYRIVEKKRNA